MAIGDDTQLATMLCVGDLERSLDSYGRLGSRGAPGAGHRVPHAAQVAAWGGWRCFARDPDGFVVEVEDHPGA